MKIPIFFKKSYKKLKIQTGILCKWIIKSVKKFIRLVFSCILKLIRFVWNWIKHNLKKLIIWLLSLLTAGITLKFGLNMGNPFKSLQKDASNENKPSQTFTNYVEKQVTNQFTIIVTNFVTNQIIIVDGSGHSNLIKETHPKTYYINGIPMQPNFIENPPLINYNLQNQGIYIK